MKLLKLLTLFFFVCLSTSTLKAQGIWQPTAGPAGSLNVIAVAASGEIFAGADKGLYRSNDDGRSWQIVNREWRHLEVEAIAINRSGVILVSSASNLYRSVDLGELWQRIDGSWADSPIRAMAPFGDKEFILAAEDDLIFTSTDGGLSWLNKGRTGGRSRATAIAATTGSSYLVAQGQELMYSRDAGESWQSKQWSPSRRVESIVILDDEHFFVSAASIYRSSDNAATWQLVADERDMRTRSLHLSWDGSLFAENSDVMYRSHDLGESWQQLIDDTIILMAGAADNGAVYWNAEGMFASDAGGGNWKRKGDGPPNGQVLALASGIAGSLWAGTVNGLFRSRNRGGRWQPVSFSPGLAHADALAATPRGQIVVGSSRANSRAYRSDDNAVSWDLIQPNGPASGGMLAAAANVHGDFCIALRNDGLYHSRDNTSAWRPVNDIPADNIITSISYGDDGLIVVGSDKGLLRSTDFGQTWSDLIFSLAGAVSYVVKSELGYLFVGVCGPDENSTGLYRSDDRGLTWEQLWQGNQAVCITDFESSPDGRLYVTSFNAVHVSEDFGVSWRRFTDGLPDLGRSAALTLGTDNTLYIATDFDAVYRLQPPPTDIEEGRSVPGLVPTLAPPVPNPCQSGVAIRMDLPQASDCRLRILSIRGDLVATLHAGRLPAGGQSFEWTVDHLAVGRYLCVLETNGGILSQPLYVKH